MKQLIKKYNMLKRFTGLLLAVALVLTSVNLFETEGKTALAADGSSEYVTEALQYSSTAPICKTEGYLFSGWYTNNNGELGDVVTEPDNTTTYLAKFVPADVLSVKCQVKTGTDQNSDDTNLRVITTLDSDNYANVGFEFYLYDSTSNQYRHVQTYKYSDNSENRLYKKIIATSDGEAYNYSANLFDATSTAFFTGTITGLKKSGFDTPILIKPFWVTMDNTQVYGVSRCVKISDSYNGIMNIPVYMNDNAEIANGATVTVTVPTGFILDDEPYVQGDIFSSLEVTDTIDTDATVTIKIQDTEAKTAKGLLANLCVKASGNLAEMKPRYTFEMSGVYADNNFQVMDIFQRNLEATEDSFDWYEENEESNTYVLATRSELLGFRYLTTKYSFADDTIELCTDIAINSPLEWNVGSEGTRTAASVPTKPAKEWTCIGKSGRYENAPVFAGTFDGKGHTISGVYIYAGTATNLGLFGEVSGTVKNLTLDDSYIYSGSSAASDGGAIAGVVAICSGTVENVKVTENVTVHGASGAIGGIVGRAGSSTSTDNTEKCTISNSWFDGVLHCKSSDKNYGFVGGILGVNRAGDTDILHCLFSGEIYGNANYVGGLCSWVRYGGLTIDDSFNSGKKTTLTSDDDYYGNNFTGGICGVVFSMSSTGGLNMPYDADATPRVTTCFLKGFNGGETEYPIYRVAANARFNGAVLNATSNKEQNAITNQGYYVYDTSKTSQTLANRVNLNLDEYWKVQEDGLPVLKSFVE